MIFASDAAVLSSGLEAMLAEYADRLVGAALATVTADGRIDVAVIGRPEAGGVDRIAPATRFSLGSVTKLLTASIICRMAEEGRLSLDDKTSRWLPEINTLERGADVTIRHLLCHSSGLADLFEPIVGIDGILAKIASHGALAEPGFLFSYSNVGYVLLGEIISRITGSNWENHIRSRLLAPLGLSQTWLEGDGMLPEGFAIDHDFSSDGSAISSEMWPRLPGMWAAAGTTMMASVQDAAQLLGAVFFGKAGDETLIHGEMLAEMQGMQIRMPGPSMFGDGWGLGWCIVDETQDLVGHMGGTSVYALGSQSLGKAAIFLSNTPNGAMIGKELTRRAIGAHPIPVLEPVLQLDTRSERFVGRYKSPTFSIEIARQAAGLVMSNNFDSDIVPLSPTGSASFMGRIGALPTEVNFIGDDNCPPRFLHMALRALTRS